MKHIISLSVLAFFPIATHAAPNFTYFADFSQGLLGLINTRLIPLFFAAAVLMFLWGMFKTFILGGGDHEKQEEGKQLMMYAIAGFVVMVSLWGIVNLVRNIFDISGNNTFTPPATPGVSITN